jgi:hypothetical protein
VAQLIANTTNFFSFSTDHIGNILFDESKSVIIKSRMHLQLRENVGGEGESLYYFWGILNVLKIIIIDF